MKKRLKNHLLISINDTISILNHTKDNQSSSSSVDKMSIRSATNANIPSDIKFNDSLPKYITQSILSRRGQQKFRQNLIYAYEGKCAVTQCSIQELLEAAHINPFSKSGNSGNITSNGILLRSDIHTLFDLGLLKITTDYKVEIADDLKGDPIYKVLNGTKLNLPKDKDHRPNIDKLRKKYIGEV